MLSVRQTVMFGAILGLVAWGMWGLATMPMTVVRGERLPTGKFVTPLGSHQGVGSYPANLILSPDGRFAVATTVGYRQQLSVIEVESGKLVGSVSYGGRGRRGLYYGLAFGPGGVLYASRGAEDLITRHRLYSSGTLSALDDIANRAPQGSKVPHTVAGLAVSSDGKQIYAVNNQGHESSAFAGSLSIIDVASQTVTGKVPLPAFPFAVAAITTGPARDQKVYVGSERDGVVAVVNLKARKVDRLIETGSHPTGMTLNAAQTRLYVCNSGSDTLSVIDTSRDTVVRSILLRPAALSGLPGSTPMSVTLDPTEQMAYVAMADLNAIAVVDLNKGTTEGYLPVGWHPTSVVASRDGRYLLVSNAKGVQAMNPNAKPVGDRGQYVLNILEGSVSRIDLAAARKDLDQHTLQVLANNVARPNEIAEQDAKFTMPQIKHVIYIIKENRTYDQVLSDLPRGNNDPSLCLFPRAVTPNQHAYAERFVHLDNFYVCAEVSADGWNWSTSGMANEYTSRNSVTNYAGRGRAYDFEGTTNGTPVDLRGLPDVAMADGGYIWDAMVKAGKSIRNYGAFLAFDGGSDDKRETKFAPDNAPTKKILQEATDPNFRRYDMVYSDSEAWVKHGLTPTPKQLAEWGPQKDKSRMSAWLRDYAALVKAGTVPNFMIVRLGRDHTSGTTPGDYAPQGMVADNDYAVGQLVEAVSNGPYWKDTAIFILEDDAQAGFDHVDAHRSIAFVISPWVKRGSLDSRFYNTDSMLKTMAHVLGVKPWNQVVAAAPLMDVFDRAPANLEPIRAILPDREIVAAVNTARSYRAADSARLINRFVEESMPDIELNDILWGAMKGARTPRPQTPRARWKAIEPWFEED